MKKLIPVIIAIGLIMQMSIVALATDETAVAVKDSGACGPELTWTLYENGTLKIAGSGEMKFGSGDGGEVMEMSVSSKETDETGIPWEPYREEITNIEIESGVTSIDSGAFSDCINLTNAAIPDSMHKIGEFAFYNCWKLENIYIPRSVEHLGRSVFISEDYTKPTATAWCEADSEPIGWWDNSTEFIYGVTRKDYDFWLGLTGEEKSVTIPEGCNIIPPNQFRDDMNLTSISIPNSVTSIGSCAFICCTNLKNVEIPDSVTNIGDYAFMECDFRTVYIPDSVKTIGMCAFYKGRKDIDDYPCVFYCKASSEPEGWASDWYGPDGKPEVNYSYTRTDYNKLYKLTVSVTPATYSGANRKPAVTVKNGLGQTLKKGTDYTVKYPAASRNVGRYTLKVVGAGILDGVTVSRTFVVNPRGTSISKLTRGKKTIAVRWKKLTTQTTGYQIRYSRKSSMASSKTVTITRNKTTSKKLTKLQAKKKYYVQVRTYKTVKGKKYYSKWSSKKAITTK